MKFRAKSKLNKGRGKKKEKRKKNEKKKREIIIETTGKSASTENILNGITSRPDVEWTFSKMIYSYIFNKAS